MLGKFLVLVFGGSLSMILTIQTLQAQDLNFALPGTVGLSGAVLDTATARLQRRIELSDIAGVVVAVARDSKIVYFQSLGQLDREAGKPMVDNALFRIYSMTRQVTSVAALLLWEEGHFQFDDPISMYLPQFENQRVFLDPANPDLGQTRERVGEITVAHLLTHTGGLGARNETIYVQNNVRKRDITLEHMVDNVAAMPLFSDPGTAFRYGLSATVLGRLIEVWSGMSFETFLQQRIFIPVGMADTVFWADSNRTARLATVYRPASGDLSPYQIEDIPHTVQPQLIEGGVGLLSTVMDYLRFSQMLLNGGMIDGNRVLGSEAVALVFENAVPSNLLPLNTRGYWLGSGWTLGGFNIVLDNTKYDFPVSNGTIWWDGSAGTRYFIDPQQQLISVIMAQISPANGNGFREEFKELVDGSIIQKR